MTTANPGRGAPSLWPPRLPDCRTLRVLASDGVAVAVQDWARPEQPPRAPQRTDVVLLHGFSQAHECWLHQVNGPLAKKLRLVSYDLRGHRASDKPPQAEYYRETARWAGELDAVIEQTGLHKPIVVAWSYAGRVLLDYLTVHGARKLGGLVFVSATTKVDAQVIGPGGALLERMSDPQPQRSLEATRALLQAWNSC